MSRQTLAEAAKHEMQARGEEVIWAGDPDLCISTYMSTGGKVEHPLNKVKAVIGAVRRSSLFEQDGYIRACDSSGTREILHPCFKIKD